MIERKAGGIKLEPNQYWQHEIKFPGDDVLGQIARRKRQLEKPTRKETIETMYTRDR